MSVAAPARSASPLVVNREHMPFDTDAGVGVRASLGLLVLRTDQTIEDEFRFALPADGVALYAARLYNDTQVTTQNLAKMYDRLPATVELLPAVDFDVVGFACTSGALVIGEDRIAALVQESLPGVRATDPVTAARAAIDALGVQRIALLTPYVAEINHALRDSLVARGMEIPVMGSFNEVDDDTVARITPASLERAILDVGASEACDAVFVSCTNLRVARIVERVEQQLGKPVTASNHALAWHMLRLAGVADEIPGKGVLFRRGL